jgi:hypothetical protein
MDDQRLEFELQTGLAELLDPVAGSHPRWATSPAADRVTGASARRWPSIRASLFWAALLGLLLVTLLASALFVGGQPTDDTGPTAWTSIEFPEAGAIFDVIEAPNGYLAVGWTEHAAHGDDGAVWASLDCLDWERMPALEFSSDQAPSTLAYAGGVYLAAGGDDPNRPAALWLSADGQDWERVTPEVTSDRRTGGPLGRLTDIAAVDDSFVAVGGARPTTPSFWISADGRGWREVTEVDPPPGGLVGRWGYTMFDPATAVTTTRSAVYAAGTTGRGEAVWRSTDGESWTQVLGGEQATGAVLQDIAASPDGTIVAVGAQWRIETHDEDWGTPVIWRSDDGSTWSMVSDMGSFTALEGPSEDGAATSLEEVARLDSVTWAGGRFFVIGGFGSFVPVAWTSTDGRAWSRASHPASEESFPIGVFDCDERVLLYGDTGEGWVRPLDSFAAATPKSE